MNTSKMWLACIVGSALASLLTVILLVVGINYGDQIWAELGSLLQSEAAIAEETLVAETEPEPEPHRHILTERELDALMKLSYREAGTMLVDDYVYGDLAGMMAVCQVVKNRVNDPQDRFWGQGDIETILRAPNQFSPGVWDIWTFEWSDINASEDAIARVRETAEEAVCRTFCRDMHVLPDNPLFFFSEQLDPGVNIGGEWYYIASIRGHDFYGLQTGK